MAILEIKGISKFFGGLGAVSDLDFHVSEAKSLDSSATTAQGKQPFSI